VVVDVAIVGAGPYGLAAAAALQNSGRTLSVLGSPMSFWDRMPAGMLLRSPYVASSIGDPAGPHGLDAYAAATGTPLPRPIPLDAFVEYGRWFQKRAVPDLDDRAVTSISRQDGVFALGLEDETQLLARRVVVAAGIGDFPRIPAVFAGLPPEHVSHASDHPDLAVLAGRRVLVVGAGQSALESAALLAESGASVQIAARADVVHWLRKPSWWLRSLGPVTRFAYAPAEVGPPLLSRLNEAPGLMRRLPPERRARFDRRSIRPAGAAWLRDRVLGVVPLTLRREVVAVRPGADGVEVRFGDGERTVVDHVLLGTGYQVDLARYPFLEAGLVAQVRQAAGYPVLRRGFETSVPGLHVLGAPSAWTFGPLMRFVAGTAFTAAHLSRSLAAAPVDPAK
jgi:hypothetical protein